MSWWGWGIDYGVVWGAAVILIVLAIFCVGAWLERGLDGP